MQPPSFQQYAMAPAQQHQQQPQYSYMMMQPASMQQLQQQQMVMQLPQQQMSYLPMYSFQPATYNYQMMPAVRQPFFPLNQFPVVASPQSMPQQAYTVPPPSSTPTTSRAHNTSLNASLLGASTSFNDSLRYNPMGRINKVRSRDHSLLVDQTTTSSDRSFQHSYIDSREMAANHDLIDYCLTVLSRKNLTEQELVAKVAKSRKFTRFGMQNLPAAISIILNTFPGFVPRTFILRTSPSDLNPVSKTIWKAEKRYQRSRGGKLNATMSEIPERSSPACTDVLSVLGDIASLNLDENQLPTAVERVPEGIKV